MKAVRELDIAPEDLTFARILARQAKRNGDKPYLLFQDCTFSYSDVDSRTNRLANALGQFGIRRGDHVAILIGNCPETLFVTYALGKIGAVVVPINTAVKGDLLTYFLTQSDSVAIVVGTESLPRYVEVVHSAPKIKRAIIVQEPGGSAAGDVTLPGVAIAGYDELEHDSEDPPNIELE